MESKNFIMSKTIWGTLIMMLPTLAPFLGVSFTADDGAMLTDSIDAIITAVGAILAILGRATASVGIKLL